MSVAEERVKRRVEVIQIVVSWQIAPYPHLILKGLIMKRRHRVPDLVADSRVLDQRCGHGAFQLDHCCQSVSGMRARIVGQRSLDR